MDRLGAAPRWFRFRSCWQLQQLVVHGGAHGGEKKKEAEKEREMGLKEKGHKGKGYK